MYNSDAVPPDPFATPDVVMERLTLAQLLDAYRQRLNKHYMPTATGAASVNSKPKYVNHREPSAPDFPSLPFTMYGSGCFMFEGFGTQLPQDMYANLVIDGIQVITNLKTLKSIIRMVDHGATGERPVFHPFVPWELPSQQSLGVDRIKFQDTVDIYF